MVASALALCLLLQQQQAQNIEHSNGSRAHLARLPVTDQTAVRVCVLRQFPESHSEHGLFHLLEHMLAKAVEDIDSSLESLGIFLRAETTRDGISLFFTAESDTWEYGLERVFDLLTTETFNESRLRTEKLILAQELDLVDWKSRLAALAWESAFDPPIYDPYGDIEQIREFDREDLEAELLDIVVAQAVSVVVAGDVDVSRGAQTVREQLGRLRPSMSWDKASREFGALPPPSLTPTIQGGARGARVSSAIDPDAVAALAFGFGFVAQHPGVDIFLNPSAQESLILLIAADRTTLDLIDHLDEYEMSETYRIGLATVRRWARNVNERPELYAEWKGWTLLARPGYSLQDLISASSSLTFERFQDGYARFRTGNTVEVIGTR